MNADTSEAALVGIDWGTSTLRAYLISAKGEVLDSQQSPDGIMQVENKDFESVLTRVLDSWKSKNTLPIIASGMITSRNGWLETPYLSTPVSVQQLANALVPLKCKAGFSIYCVTGATTERKGVPDVMRGEELQIAGAVASGIKSNIFVMPGTHSKWVTVRDECIVDFETAMSGEIFEALRSHTILGTLMLDSDFSEEGFREGVAAGLDANPKLLHTLFSVRTLPLFGKLDGSKVADYLSGILIGAEVQGAISNQVFDEPVTIVGRDDLADRYAMVLEILGIPSQRVPEDAVARGYFSVANSAGLLS